MFNTEKFAFIRCEETPELTAELNTALESLKPLNAFMGLKKGWKVIRVHETCVSEGAGTDNQRWKPIITVTEETITRDNPKTYSAEHTGGYRHTYSCKYTKGDTKPGYYKNLDNGFINTLKFYYIPS